MFMTRCTGAAADCLCAHLVAACHVWLCSAGAAFAILYFDQHAGLKRSNFETLIVPKCASCASGIKG